MDSGARNIPISVFGYRLRFSIIAMGAFFSPLVCQSLMSKGIPWQRFYLGSLVLSGINLIFVVFAYHPTGSEFNNDRIQASRAAADIESSHVELPSLSETHSSSMYSSVARPRSSESTFCAQNPRLIFIRCSAASGTVQPIGLGVRSLSGTLFGKVSLAT
jgi:hypothetical protein